MTWLDPILFLAGVLTGVLLVLGYAVILVLRGRPSPPEAWDDAEERWR